MLKWPLLQEIEVRFPLNRSTEGECNLCFQINTGSSAPERDKFSPIHIRGIT